MVDVVPEAQFWAMSAVLPDGQKNPAEHGLARHSDTAPMGVEAPFQVPAGHGDATTAPDGRIIPPAGTSDMFNKYLALKADGSNAEAAKAMLEAMGSKVETNFNQKKAAPAPAPKKK